MAIIDIEKQLVLSILLFSEAVRVVLLKGCLLPSVSYVDQQHRSTELAATISKLVVTHGPVDFSLMPA